MVNIVERFFANLRQLCPYQGNICYFCKWLWHYTLFGMILIADSGSTKTDWVLTSDGTVNIQRTTAGINPFHQTREEISCLLAEELIPFIPEDIRDTAIYFYGSGCTPEQCPMVTDLLREAFPSASPVEVASDMLGAARAVLGNQEGVACILGTGANSCLYDGHRIVRNVPPLGYILGDEGSGAVLGKLFMNAVFKGLLPSRVRETYLSWAGITYADVIERVYRQPLANRFLASVVPFIKERLPEEPALREIVVDNFRSFFHRNLTQYGDCRKVGFVGGVAWTFRDLLVEVSREEGYLVTTILKSPMEGLLAYHHAANFPDKKSIIDSSPFIPY